MACLTVGAGAETSCGERNDFDKFVLSNLGQVEHWQLLFGEETDSVTLERLFDHLDYSVDLRYSNYTDLLKSSQVSVSLRNTARHNDRLSFLLR